jgi:ribosome-binding factor A
MASKRRPGSNPKPPSQRQLRVGEVLRHALAEVFREEEIRDPDLLGVSVTVTEIRPSPDMRHATAYVEPLGGANADVVVKALNRHRGFLRGELGHRITTKFTPELRFVEDTSFAEAAHIEGILRSEKVSRDLKAGDEDSDPENGDPENGDLENQDFESDERGALREENNGS